MRAFRAEKGIVRYICYQRSLRNVAPKCSAPNVQAWKLELMAREIYKNVWQDHRQDILEEYQQEQENGAANSEKVEEALRWQESFPNDEISRGISGQICAENLLHRWTEIHLGTKSISRVMHCSMQCARNVQLPFDFGGKNHAGKNKSEERGWGRQ